MLRRQDQVNSENDQPTLISVASRYFIDLESPFERTTLTVERAMSEPVEPRFELFLLLELRDILIELLTVTEIPCHFDNSNSASTAATERDSWLSVVRRHLVVETLQETPFLFRYFRLPSMYKPHRITWVRPFTRDYDPLLTQFSLQLMYHKGRKISVKIIIRRTRWETKCYKLIVVVLRMKKSKMADKRVKMHYGNGNGCESDGFPV